MSPFFYIYIDSLDLPLPLQEKWREQGGKGQRERFVLESIHEKASHEKARSFGENPLSQTEGSSLSKSIQISSPSALELGKNKKD